MKISQNYSQSEQGFTLIEVLVASAILVILAFGFLAMQYIIGQNQVSVWRDYLSIESANSILSNIAKELRDARQSSTGTYLLEIADDDEIVFYSDIDYDGDIERVHYVLSGNVLTKGIVEPTGEPVSYPLESEKTRIITDIVRNEDNKIFFYFNSDWPQDTINNPLTQDTRISDTVQMKIYIKTNPKGNNSKQDYILETEVRLRNIN